MRYFAYLFLWDATRLNEESFREKSASLYHSARWYPTDTDVFLIHEVDICHSSVSTSRDFLPDEEVIRLAGRQVDDPFEFEEDVPERRSVQERDVPEYGFGYYNAVFLHGEADGFLLTLAYLRSWDYEDSAGMPWKYDLTPADCRGEDQVEVDVPRCGFRAEYTRALNSRTHYELYQQWRSEDVCGLARGMAAEGHSDWLPVLADALEEAGFEDAAVLHHCRSKPPHSHRCWVLDFILGAPGQADIARAIEAVWAAQCEARTAAEVLDALEAIDTTGCPDDFRSAHLAHLCAWESMASVERDASATEDGSDGQAVCSWIRGQLSRSQHLRDGFPTPRHPCRRSAGRRV